MKAKVKVMYHTRKGNTEKVANAICQVVEQRVPELVPPAYLPENLELLFLGAGTYMGKVDKTVTKFINMLSKDRVSNVALFSTTAKGDEGIQQMKALLEERGIHVLEDTFVCKRKAFLFANAKNPNSDDLEAAKAFAATVVEKLAANKKA